MSKVYDPNKFLYTQRTSNSFPAPISSEEILMSGMYSHNSSLRDGQHLTLHKKLTEQSNFCSFTLTNQDGKIYDLSQEACIVSQASILFSYALRRINEDMPEFMLRTEEDFDVFRRIKSNGAMSYKVMNYYKDYLSFAKIFFHKNLYKSLIAILNLRKMHGIYNIPFCDLGCGASPSSIAWSLVYPNYSGEYILIDKCAAQLNLARHLLDIFRIKNYNLVHGDCIDALPKISSVKFASYWLCSQPIANIRLHQHDLLDQLMICVDYRHVLDSVKMALQLPEAFDMNVQIALPRADRSCFLDSVINVSCKAFCRE